MSVMLVPECDRCQVTDEGLWTKADTHDTPGKAVESLRSRMKAAGWSSRAIKDYCPECTSLDRGEGKPRPDGTAATPEDV